MENHGANSATIDVGLIDPKSYRARGVDRAPVMMTASLTGMWPSRGRQRMGPVGILSLPGDSS
jgi:hypothetical protein